MIDMKRLTGDDPLQAIDRELASQGFDPLPEDQRKFFGSIPEILAEYLDQEFNIVTLVHCQMLFYDALVDDLKSLTPKLRLDIGESVAFMITTLTMRKMLESQFPVLKRSLADVDDFVSRLEGLETSDKGGGGTIAERLLREPLSILVFPEVDLSKF